MYYGLDGIPILFLAGAKDELVPHRQMIELYNTALQSAKAYNGSEKKELIRMHVIPDGTHNESWLQGGYAYWDAIRNFMTTTLQEQKVGGSMVSGGPVVPVNTDSAVDNVQSSSIPTMSSRFIDMAKDAMSNNNGHKKEL
jgi:hypothetical protein